MLRILLRPGFALAPVLFCITPAIAGFTLPGHSRIAVTAFAVPAEEEAERDFSRTLRERMVFALREEGFTVVLSREGGSESILAEQAPGLPGAMKKNGTTASLETGPVTPGSRSAAEVPESAPERPDAMADGVTEAPVRDKEVGDAILAGPDVAGKADLVESVALRPESAPQTAALTTGMEAEIEPVPENALPMGPEYVLRGRITLLRERVGSPTRIGGDIRIRTESVLHCAYTVEDALTGFVLVSDVASGSSARVVGPSNDIDAALHDLTDKVMASAAQLIAARLSGSAESVVAAGSRNDREEYQDSPGKRLKSK